MSMNNPCVSSSFFIWLAWTPPTWKQCFGGVFIFTVTFCTVKSHSICACLCRESHLMFLRLQISHQEHPVHLLAFLPSCTNPMTLVMVPFVSPTAWEIRKLETHLQHPIPGHESCVPLYFRSLCAFAFLFTASDVWVVDISRENTDTLDTVLVQSRQQGMVLFLQSEYSGNKISQLQLVEIESLIGHANWVKFLAA